MDENSKLDRALRLKQLLEIVPISRSGIYRAIARGKFPAPIPLGPRSVGFLESEVRAWMDENIALRNTGRSTTLITQPCRRPQHEALSDPAKLAAQLNSEPLTKQVMQDDE